MPAHRAATRTRRARAAALGGLTLLSVVGPGTGMAFAAGNDVHNCGEYRYQEDAQEVYDADISDPNQLDNDNDGIACETRPHRPSSTTPPISDVDLDDDSSDASPSPAVSHEASRHSTATHASGSTRSSRTTTDRDCADFSSQQEAQDALDADPSDPERLDGDDDGLACESFDYGDDDTDSTASPAPVVAQAAEAPQYPVGGVDAGDGSVPAEGSDALSYALLGAAAVAGAVGTRYVGRHRRA